MPVISTILKSTNSQFFLLIANALALCNNLQLINSKYCNIFNKLKLLGGFLSQLVQGGSIKDCIWNANYAVNYIIQISLDQVITKTPKWQIQHSTNTGLLMLLLVNRFFSFWPGYRLEFTPKICMLSTLLHESHNQVKN